MDIIIRTPFLKGSITEKDEDAKDILFENVQFVPAKGDIVVIGHRFLTVVEVRWDLSLDTVTLTCVEYDR